MIVIKNTGTDVILGTTGEKVIVAGLRMVFSHGTREQQEEAARLLQYLGTPEFHPRSLEDWEQAEKELQGS